MSIEKIEGNPSEISKKNSKNDQDINIIEKEKNGELIRKTAMLDYSQTQMNALTVVRTLELYIDGKRIYGSDKFLSGIGMSKEELLDFFVLLGMRFRGRISIPVLMNREGSIEKVPVEFIKRSEGFINIINDYTAETELYDIYEVLATPNSRNDQAEVLYSNKKAHQMGFNTIDPNTEISRWSYRKDLSDKEKEIIDIRQTINGSLKIELESWLQAKNKDLPAQRFNTIDEYVQQSIKKEVDDANREGDIIDESDIEELREYARNEYTHSEKFIQSSEEVDANIKRIKEEIYQAEKKYEELYQKWLDTEWKEKFKLLIEEKKKEGFKIGANPIASSGL